MSTTLKYIVMSVQEFNDLDNGWPKLYDRGYVWAIVDDGEIIGYKHFRTKKAADAYGREL